MGPDMLVIFNKIDLPDLPNIHATQLLWKQFKILYDNLHSETISFRSAVQFEENAKEWVKDFTKIYQTKHVTPYMHILAMHVPEFLKSYGNLITFTQQCLEKYNDQMIISSANHNYRNLEALW